MDAKKNILIPSLMIKLTNIVKQVGENQLMKEFSTSIGYYYSKEVNGFEVSFGIDYDYWKDSGNPFTIMIQNKKNGYVEFDLTLKDENIESFSTIESSSEEVYYGYYLDIKYDIDKVDYIKQVNALLLKILKELEHKENKS